MRTVLAVTCLLTGCGLYFGSGQTSSVDGTTCSDPRPSGNCQCARGTWWCSDCPFGEGSDPVACSTEGAGCQIETWEHGCECTCEQGWWSCNADTIGSQCPSGPPPPDAGIDDAPPDAVPPDAAACSPIEAENIGVHPGWGLSYGAPSGGESLEASSTGAPLTFDFTGTALAMSYEIGPNNGSYSVTIDGGAPVAVAAYQANDFTWRTTTVATGLAYRSHTATVTCTALRCNVDVFDVTCN